MIHYTQIVNVPIFSVLFSIVNQYFLNHRIRLGLSARPFKPVPKTGENPDGEVELTEMESKSTERRNGGPFCNAKIPPGRNLDLLGSGIVRRFLLVRVGGW